MHSSYGQSIPLRRLHALQWRVCHLCEVVIWILLKEQFSEFPTMTHLMGDTCVQDPCPSILPVTPSQGPNEIDLLTYILKSV